MVYLVAKTVQNATALAKLTDDVLDPQNPLAGSDLLHCYFTIGFPQSDVLEKSFLDTGFGRLTLHDGYVLATASKNEWLTIVRILNKDQRRAVRQFTALLIQSFPDIFRGLSTQLGVDGTLMIRG